MRRRRENIMIEWRSKLTSRKFWAAIAQFISMLIIALHGTQETATQVTALIMAGAAVVAYIIGEGLIDAAAVKPYDDEEDYVDEPPDKTGDEDDLK